MTLLLTEPELIQEFRDSRGVEMSVDREVGILRGVKLIGLESRNGRRYRESALATAASLYESAKVNVNHSKEGPLTPRDYQDRLGVIRSVELRAGEGLFGDLHFNPKHSLAEQLLWDAEHNPHNVGFSHNVMARLSRVDETVVVEEITKVQSVDLVADPATTQGLFEQASESKTIDDKQHWDALTIETLRQHRPDLLSEIETQESLQLQQQLKEACERSTSLVRKQRVFELLCKNGLSIAEVQSTTEQQTVSSNNNDDVSPLFVDLLMDVSDDEQLEALIAERAALVREAASRRHISVVNSTPFSRDQTLVLPGTPVACASAQDFAEILKSSIN